MDLIYSDDSHRIGNSIWHAEKVGSTSSTLRHLVDDGWAGHGAVVWADEQTEGRGRLGRPWHSPPGSGLYTSVYVTNAESPVLHCWIALAAKSAIEEITEGQAGIKWPNDVLVDGRKVGGLLVERLPEGAVVGVGINTNTTPIELARIGPEAGSLKSATGVPVDHWQFLQGLLRHLQSQYIRSRTSSDLVFSEWKTTLVTLGQTVEVETTRETWLGEAVDVAIDGSLLVLNDKRLVRVYAADVRIRPK